MNAVLKILLAAGVAFAVYAFFFLTIFVIQPIGALPEGKTLIVSRIEGGQFFDSADAFCERRTGGVSLLCRSMAISKYLDAVSIYARLPYSKWLYLASTGGKEYDR